MADEQVKDEKPQEINYQQDIHNTSLEDLAEEWGEEEEKLASNDKSESEQSAPSPQESVKVDEKPQEPIKEPKKEEPVVETKQQTIDEDKITNSITEKILEKLAPEDTTKAEKKDIKEKIAELTKKAADEGRELTYVEALEFLQNETKSSVKEELKEELRSELKKEVIEDLNNEVKQEEAKAKDRAEAIKQQQQAYKAEWDRQINALTESGSIPKIENIQDPNDPGVKEQLALLEQFRDWNTKNPQSPITNLVEFYTTRFKSPNQKPVGADAPVFGARRSVTPTDPNSYTYQDIRNTSLEDLVHSQG